MHYQTKQAIGIYKNVFLFVIRKFPESSSKLIMMSIERSSYLQKGRNKLPHINSFKIAIEQQ